MNITLKFLNEKIIVDERNIYMKLLNSSFYDDT